MCVIFLHVEGQKLVIFGMRLFNLVHCTIATLMEPFFLGILSWNFFFFKMYAVHERTKHNTSWNYEYLIKIWKLFELKIGVYVVEILNRKLLWNCHKLLILLAYWSSWRLEFDTPQFHKFSKEKGKSNIMLRIIR